MHYHKDSLSWRKIEHYIDNIVDESVDVEKIVETQMMIEAVIRAISKLKDIIHPALIKICLNE